LTRWFSVFYDLNYIAKSEVIKLNGKTMNLKTIKQWHIKLKVSIEEERKIKKEAIDQGLQVGEYIKLKVLGDSSTKTFLDKGK